MLLSLYMQNINQPLPSQKEVLLCDRRTSAEQVRISILCSCNQCFLISRLPWTKSLKLHSLGVRMTIFIGDVIFFVQKIQNLTSHASWDSSHDNIPPPPFIRPWDLSSCHWHLVAITGDQFKLVHLRTYPPPHPNQYWHLVVVHILLECCLVFRIS